MFSRLKPRFAETLRAPRGSVSSRDGFEVRVTRNPVEFLPRTAHRASRSSLNRSMAPVNRLTWRLRHREILRRFVNYLCVRRFSCGGKFPLTDYLGFVKFPIDLIVVGERYQSLWLSTRMSRAFLFSSFEFLRVPGSVRYADVAFFPPCVLGRVNRLVFSAYSAGNLSGGSF